MRRANILLIEGDSEARIELRAALRALGHSLIGEADTGNQGLSLARNLRPDLVLVNAALSGVSGLDVSRLLVEESVAPTLILADPDTGDDPRDLVESGAMGYLTKPARDTDLGPVIQLAIARWRQIVDLQSEVRALNERMEARRLVGRAKAILMERNNLPEREAFRRIQAQSVALGRPVHEIAKAIITASEIPT